MRVRFDDSLKALVDVISARLGKSAFDTGCVLRDTSGRLAFFHGEPIAIEHVGRLTEELKVRLGGYAREDRCVAGSDEIGVADLLQDPSALFVAVGEVKLRLIDRRLVGADWLRRPKEAADPPPRFVFASLKGGVGRSTALSVTAAQLASRGRIVLAIDMDMEAPGLGSILLRPEELPQFGLVDALVENAFGALDHEFMTDLVSSSGLAQGKGRIDVIPAFGSRSVHNPGNILAKIARAYAEDIDQSGEIVTLLDQISAIVDYFSSQGKYEAILIDARSGLHETTATAILGLGAEIFLFGLDEPQTFAGYQALLSHLARFIEPGSQMPDWIERLTMVQAKAPANVEGRASFAEKCELLFERTGLLRRNTVQDQRVPLPAGPFNNVPWNDEEDLDLIDEIAPQPTLVVLDDDRFRLFDPLRRTDLLSSTIYQTSFGALIDRVESVLPGT